MSLSRRVGVYLIPQAGSTLQQSLSCIFIDNQSTDLWRNRLFLWRVWTAASSWWAFLIGWRRWQTFGSGWWGNWSFDPRAIIIQGKRGATLPQTAAFGLILKTQISQSELSARRNLSVIQSQIKVRGSMDHEPALYNTSCYHQTTGGHCNLFFVEPWTIKTAI